jgi:hypothetical protein
MADRAPSTIWILRKIGAPTNGGVRTTEDDRISILYYGEDADRAQSIILSRKDARLLAKRINQCLDSTARS